MKPTEIDLMVARAVVGRNVANETDLTALIEALPEPAEHEQAAQDDDGTLVGLLRDAEDLINKAEQAAQDAEQPYPQDTGDWRFGPCVRCGDDPITWPQSDTTPIKCLTCQSYERGLAEGARAERERIDEKTGWCVYGLRETCS